MYQCMNCNKQFIKKTDYTRHLNRKTPCNKNKEFKCDICLYDFKNNFNLERHKKRKNPCKHFFGNTNEL